MVDIFSKWEGKGTWEEIQCAPTPFIPAIGILVTDGFEVADEVAAVVLQTCETGLYIYIW